MNPTPKFILDLNKKVALKREVALFTKINQEFTTIKLFYEYDIYNKCKRARPLYLQIIRYFKQFNIGSSPSVNRFIETYVTKAYELKKQMKIRSDPYPELSKQQERYLNKVNTTLYNFIDLISNRTAVVKDVLKTKTPLPYDLFPLICDYIGA